jgi:hypothetical protein
VVIWVAEFLTQSVSALDVHHSLKTPKEHYHQQQLYAHGEHQG